METYAPAKKYQSRPYDTQSVKVPPHSIEAEQSVLGGIMLDHRAWDTIVDHVSEADFYRHDHRLIYRSMQKLSDAGKPLDVLTVTESLRELHQLDNAGGEIY